MSKLFALLIFSSILFFNFYAGVSFSKDISAPVAPTVTPTPESSNKSISIELDKDSVSPECPPGYRPTAGRTCGDGMLITVTVADKLEDAALIYQYNISGGRIVGEGAKIVWDLTGAQPGTYRITVGIKGESKALNQSQTKTITVFDDCCNGDYFCPDFSVAAPKSPIETGEMIVFTASIAGSGGGLEKAVYNWTVSAGKIIEGQGTPVIKVATNSKMAGKTVEAKVSLSGSGIFFEVCEKTKSATIAVIRKKRKK